MGNIHPYFELIFQNEGKGNKPLMPLESQGVSAFEEIEYAKYFFEVHNALTIEKFSNNLRIIWNIPE